MSFVFNALQASRNGPLVAKFWIDDFGQMRVYVPGMPESASGAEFVVEFSCHPKDDDVPMRL